MSFIKAALPQTTSLFVIHDESVEAAAFLLVFLKLKSSVSFSIQTSHTNGSIESDSYEWSSLMQILNPILLLSSDPAKAEKHINALGGNKDSSLTIIVLGLRPHSAWR